MIIMITIAPDRLPKSSDYFNLTKFHLYSNGMQEVVSFLEKHMKTDTESSEPQSEAGWYVLCTLMIVAQKHAIKINNLPHPCNWAISSDSVNLNPR